MITLRMLKHVYGKLAFHVKGDNVEKAATNNLSELMVFQQENLKCIPLWSRTSDTYTLLKQN